MVDRIHGVDHAGDVILRRRDVAAVQLVVLKVCFTGELGDAQHVEPDRLGDRSRQAPLHATDPRQVLVVRRAIDDVQGRWRRGLHFAHRLNRPLIPVAGVNDCLNSIADDGRRDPTVRVFEHRAPVGDAGRARHFAHAVRIERQQAEVRRPHVMRPQHDVAHLPGELDLHGDLAVLHPNRLDVLHSGGRHRKALEEDRRRRVGSRNRLLARRRDREGTEQQRGDERRNGSAAGRGESMRHGSAGRRAGPLILA